MPREIKDSCNNCGKCTKVCPVEKCITSSDIHRINPDLCIDCLQCVSVCSQSAIHLYIPEIELPIEES